MIFGLPGSNQYLNAFNVFAQGYIDTVTLPAVSPEKHPFDPQSNVLPSVPLCSTF